MRRDYTKKLSNVIEINESQIQDHLGELVRGTVEETINAMLDAEADALCNASRYERSEARKDTRASPSTRSIQPRAIGIE
ncbi:transposase [Desulfopila inferna]|nr:transposase [Desulfopila inferna]MBM9606723.1 transposase [Desulfopila inferna]